jgi:DNA-binding IclR family transcriptional regulator
VKYKVPALEKGLDIIEALSHASTPLSLRDLSKMLGRSSSELFRMVGGLEQRGYIVKDALSSNYYLSLKLFELAHTHSPLEKILRAAEGPMRELSAETRESCHLGVPRNGQLFILSQADGPNKLRLSVEVGANFSMVGTSSGRLLLAAMPPEELEKTLNESSDYADLKKQEKKELASKLQEIRDKQFSYAENEYLYGARDLSVLVGNTRIGLLASLAISSLTRTQEECDFEKFLEPLRNCAKTITEALGVSHVSFDILQK